MNDLISRKQAIKEICREVSEQESNAIQGEDLDVGVIVGLKMAVRIIKDQLSAEKTGKWLKAQYPFERCSVCGAYFDTASNQANYCCVCGARMVEE